MTGFGRGCVKTPGYAPFCRVFLLMLAGAGQSDHFRTYA
jgi:hypothetical protein